MIPKPRPPFDKNPAFDLLGEYPISITVNGIEHTVNIRYSIVKQEARIYGGNSPIGKQAAKNQGISVVRAKRELEMNNTFDIRYDPRERWWGIEVLFEPGLDDVFGVTNNKQAATAFYNIDIDQDAAAEGMSSGDYEDKLKESNDPRLAIYAISREITRNLRILRSQIERMREGSRTNEEAIVLPGSVEDIATRATKHRREVLGREGRSDKEEELPEPEREKELTSVLVDDGMPEDKAKGIAVEYVKKNIKYLFKEAELPAYTMFDVSSKAGTIIILINTRHPAKEELFELLKSQDDANDTPALKALKLLLTAWARLEDEATSEQRRQNLEDIRSDWGRIARDFLQELD